MTDLSHKAIAGPHLIRYGTAGDQKYLLNEFRDTYDQLVVNATMLAHMKAALSVFVTQRAKKPYFIDPQTHAFQHEIAFLQTDSGDLKRSVKTLLKAYGDPVQKCVERGDVVLPEDFRDAKERRDFCHRVLDYQSNEITREVQTGPDSKFLQFIAKKKGVQLAEYGPTLIVAPYFFMTASTFDDWRETNLNLVHDSKELVQNTRPLATQVVISKDLLENDKLRRQLISAYTADSVKPDVFLVWVDSFTEQEVGEPDLRSYVEFVRGLGRSAPVVSLYGGFFSTVLARCGIAPELVGVCHSLEYGESRAVVPVGGGVPVAKFYLKALHERLKFRDALRAVKALTGFQSVENYRTWVCDCPECSSRITTNPEMEFTVYGRTNPVRVNRGSQGVSIVQYPTSETKDHCVRHYMWCKRDEWKCSEDKGILIAELGEAASKLKRALGLDFVAHADVWTRILKNP